MSQSAPYPNQPAPDPAVPSPLMRQPAPLVAGSLTTDEFRLLRNSLGLGADQLAQMLEEFGDEDIARWPEARTDSRASSVARHQGWTGDLSAQRVKGWERGRTGPTERASLLVVLLDQLVTALAAEVLAHARHGAAPPSGLGLFSLDGPPRDRAVALCDLPPRDGRTATAMLDEVSRQGALAPWALVSARLLVNAPPEAIQALCAAAWSRAWLMARIAIGPGAAVTSGRL